MRKLLFLLFMLGPASLATASEHGVILMQEAARVGNILVKPATEYTVDLTGYEVPEEANLLIFHVLDSPVSHYYYQKIEPGKTSYRMNAETLKGTTGSPPFKGLARSDGAFLIIGSEVQPGSIDMGVLYNSESISVIVRE